jgi:hypothetical protein
MELMAGRDACNNWERMLHTALATAPDRPMFHVAAALAGVALCGAGIALVAEAIHATDAAPVAAAAPASAAPVAPPAPVAPLVSGASDDAAAMKLVIRAGGASYLWLADLTDCDEHDEAIAVPRHGALHLSRDRSDDTVAAVAMVADRDVPGTLQRWQGRRVEVDASCTATVVGFAVVARRVDSHAGRWTAAEVLGSGHAVLAARLDGCIGSFARDLGG